jgi:hypothetical protein
MSRFWKVAALVAIVAIPLVILSKKRVVEKGFVPESGDSTDIFEQELLVD